MLYDYKERFLNFVVGHLPAILQYFFMGRVIKIVKSSLSEEEARQVLFTKKEGSLRSGRPNQSSSSIRTPQLDLLGVQEPNQPLLTYSELWRSDCRAYRAAMQRRKSYVGQRSPRARIMQLRQGRFASR